MTAYPAFLCFNELAYIHCRDVKFVDNQYVELFIAKSKTDVYRNGSTVVLARTGHITCPFDILSRYAQVAKIDYLLI